MNGVVRYTNVEVVEDAGSALLCTVAGKRVWVPVLEIRYGTEVGKTGDRGKLVIPRRLAQQIGLVAPSRNAHAIRLNLLSPLGQRGGFIFSAAVSRDVPD